MANQALAQDSAVKVTEERKGPFRVCAVVLTHGDRRHLLHQVLLALLKETAVWKIVLVSNGALWDVQALARELAPDRIVVVDLRTNHGAAPGYAAGMKRACELGADFIWLLDHDNEPQDGALAELLAAHARLSNDFAKDKLAVLAFRPNYQRDVALGVPLRRLDWRPSSFLGFNVFDMPNMFWRRTPWGRPKPRRTMPSMVEMTIAPYGGLLFHRAVVETHGLPREDFVVYADDGEFTSRITRNGGAVRLVTAAKVIDLELSWRFSGRYRTSFQWRIEGGSDSPSFYGTRNLTYLESHCLPCNRLVYWVNRRVYCFGLWLFALVLRRSDRYRLLQSAIRDGLDGRLGLHPEYPL